MRRSFLLSPLGVIGCALVSLAGINASTIVNHPHRLTVPATKTTPITLKTTKTAQKTTKSLDDTAVYVDLLSEDFSKCDSGSETYPDIYSIADAETLTIDPQYTNVAGWSGELIYQAGGCVYIGVDDDNEPGLLNTPTFNSTENEGKFVLTLRTRTQTEGTRDALCLVSCDMNTYSPTDPSASILDYQFIAISSEWTEYQVELQGGSTKNLVQIYSYSQPIFVDDISVKQVRSDALAAPKVYSATNITADGFAATWGQVTNAESYLLNVFYYNEVLSNSEDGPVTVTEGFDGIVGTGSKNKFIDTENSTFPEGWVIDLSSNGTSREIYTTEGNYSSAGVSLCFDATDDYIETPLTDEPIEKFSFWLKMQGADNSKITFEAYNGTEWSEIGEWTSADVTKNFAGVLSYTIDNSDIVKLRLKYTRGAGNVGIDDVSYTYGKENTESNKVYALKDFEVTDGCSYNVTGLDMSHTYYYNVRAKKGDVVSDYSKDVMVTEATLDAPVALDATNVTADSFTANWEAVENADAYMIGVWQYHSVAAGEDYNLFTSKFDAWTTGTVDNPVTDEMVEEGESAFILDYKYGNRYNWTINQPAGANGMIGFMVGSGQTKGGIISDNLFPSENGGKVKVKFTAYAKNATKAVVAVKYDGIGKEATVDLSDGEGTYEVDVDCGMPAYQISISAEGEESGYVLFKNLDITQNFPNKTEIDFCYLVNGTYYTSYNVDTKGIDPNDSFMYMVYAVKLIEGNVSEVSGFSDFIIVSDRNASVNSVTADNNYKILPTANGVTVTLDSAMPVSAYTLDGRVVYNAAAGALSHDISLGGHGVYIIKVGNKATKVAR